jgi:hypothetical protein
VEAGHKQSRGCIAAEQRRGKLVYIAQREDWNEGMLLEAEGCMWALVSRSCSFGLHKSSAVQLPCRGPSPSVHERS